MTTWLVLALLFQVPASRVDTGVVTGTVRHPDGKPVAGVRVAAMPADADNTPGIASALIALAQTDDFGRFRLTDVPAGDYYIVAGRVDALTYYPAAPDLAAAQVVMVTAGSMLDGVDITVRAESLQPPPSPLDRLHQLFSYIVTPTLTPIQVRGRVVVDEGSTGSKLPQAFVITLHLNTGFALPGGRSRSQTLQTTVRPTADGSFTAQLASGRASISVAGLPQGYSVKSITSDGRDLLAQSVEIRPDMPEVVIVLSADFRPRVRVSGTVIDTATGRGLLGEQIELISDSGATSRLIIEPQGRFVFPQVLPGNYVLHVNSSRFAPIERRITVSAEPIELELRTTPR